MVACWYFCRSQNPTQSSPEMQGGLDGEDTLLDTLRDTLAATLEDTLADSPSHICNHSPKETPTETLTETLRETLTDGLKDIGTPRDSSNLSTRREDTHRDSCRDCKDVRTDGLIVPNQTLHSLEAFPALPSSAATPPTAHWTPLLAARKTAPELRLEIPLAKQVLPHSTRKNSSEHPQESLTSAKPQWRSWAAESLTARHTVWPWCLSLPDTPKRLPKQGFFFSASSQSQSRSLSFYPPRVAQTSSEGLLRSSKGSWIQHTLK